MATQKTPVHIAPSVPNLRVFRKLDVDSLSDDFIDKIQQGGEFEYEYVDGDRARDFDLTGEIIETTIGAALVSAEGDILHEWEGEGAVAKAENARNSAKVTFSLDIDED